MKNRKQEELQDEEILKSLKEGHKLYKSLLNTTPDAVIITNLEGKIILVTDKVLKYSGFDSVDDLIGHYQHELIHPEDLDKMREMGEKVMSHMLQNQEIRALKKDGTYYTCEFNANLIKDDQGKPLAYIATMRDITRRKKMENAIKGREKAYRELYENALVGLWKSNLNDGSFIRANKTVANMVGYESPEELMEKSTTIDLFSKEFRKLFQYKLEKYGRVNEFETKFTDIKGNEKIVSVSARIDPEEQTIEGAILDITNLKNIEKALEASEEQYRTTLNSIIDPIHVVNKQTEIILMNHAFRDWLIRLGLNSDCIGKRVLDCFPFLIESVIDQYKMVFETKREIHTIEKNMIDNNEYITEVSKFPIFDNERNVKQVITVIHDVTDKNQMQRKLMESEQKFRRIFDAIPDLFFMVDKDSRVLEFKGRKEELYTEPEKILGSKLSELLPQKFSDLATSSIKKVAKTKNPQIIEYSLPVEEKLRYYEARILYFSQHRFGIFIRDITDRKEAEEVIRREVERLKEIDEMRKSLITRVSHEIKTPLMSINGAVEILIEAGDNFDLSENLNFLNMVRRNAERLNKLIGRLLDITRMEYQKFALNLERCDLCELVHEISHEMEYFLDEKKIGIILDVPDKLDIELDKIRFQQVITNLISNAIKNTPPKGKITIRVKTAGDFIQIEVEDTGVGLTEQELKIIFKRFGKIERDEVGLEYLNIQGSGLGLFISKEIVRLHGGEIWAESEGRHKGSKFTLKIPIK